MVRKKGYAAHPGEKCIENAAAEEHGKAEGTEKGTQKVHGQFVMAACLADIIQPLGDLVRIGLAVANSTAQTGEPFHGIQIIAVIADAAHTGHGFAFRGFDTDRQTIGNCKYF